MRSEVGDCDYQPDDDPPAEREPVPPIRNWRIWNTKTRPSGTSIPKSFSKLKALIGLSEENNLSQLMYSSSDGQSRQYTSEI